MKYEDAMFIRLLKTEFKRISYYGIYIIITAALLMSLFTFLSIKAGDIVYKTQDNEPLAIGIAMSPESKFAGMAYDMIKGMDSYKASCSFVPFDNKEDALNEMDKGTLYAVIYVPDNIIHDIMYGENTPIEVYYSDSTSIDTFVINDLFTSTSSMLGISQAAIYSVQALGRELEPLEEVRGQLSDDVNMFFLTSVLDRTSLFVIDKVNATATKSMTGFYICASMIILMLLCGVVFIAYRQNAPKVYRDRLKQFHINGAVYNLVSFICMLMWEYILYLSVYLILIIASCFTDKLSIIISTGGLLYGFATAFLVTLMILVVDLLPAGIHGSTMLLGALTIAIAYVNGFFIPEAFLPEFAKKLCDMSAFNRLAHLLCQTIWR